MAARVRLAPSAGELPVSFGAVSAAGGQLFRTAACAAIALATLSGCGAAGAQIDVPAGGALLKLGAVDPGGPFAPHPDGKQVALSQGGLRLVGGQAPRALDPRPARALRWSADGARLAAAFEVLQGSEVRVLGLAGESTVTMQVPGQVVALLWHPDGDLLALSVLQKAFRFGVQVQTWLFRQGRSGPLQRWMLDEHTAPPLRKGAALALQAPVFADLSPLGDELLYTRSRHPPVIVPYVEVRMRHLGGGAERSVLKVGLASGGARISPDGEEVLVADGAAQVLWRRTWQDVGRRALLTPGRRLALSPGGHSLYADGQVHSGGAVVARLPATAEAVFTPRGDALAFRHEGAVWLLSGLKADPLPSLDLTYTQRLLPLRRWRAEGLIDQAEYDKRKAALDK